MLMILRKKKSLWSKGIYEPSSGEKGFNAFVKQYQARSDCAAPEADLGRNFFLLIIYKCKSKDSADFFFLYLAAHFAGKRHVL